MALKTYGESGWAFSFVFSSKELAKKAWLDATEVLDKQDENQGLGVYNIRFEETGQQHIVILGGGILPEELKDKFLAIVQDGKEEDITDDVLLQVLMIHERTRDPDGKPKEFHNLRAYSIIEKSR